MTTSNIDTFEHDISNEIKQKEATLIDIASASGDIKNSTPPTEITPEKKHISTLFLISVITLCVSGIIASGIFGYNYYTKKQAIANKPTETPLGPSIPAISLAIISPTLDQQIGRFINTVQQTENGYSMAITSYPSVYAYMIKNEISYADEIAEAVGSARDFSTTTTPFTFNDVTINNQNMRIGTSGSSTVIYAFTNNTQMLLISSTTEGILLLRDAIVR